MRKGLVGVGLALLLVAPGTVALVLGVEPSAALTLLWIGLADARAAVGWVLIPQLLLAVGVLGLLMERLACRFAGVGAHATPRWLDPAIESALLLGMLGTISGMVRGFAGIAPEQVEAGPLLHALGTALRSSFLGFGIALVGVWTRDGPDLETAA